MRLVIKNKQEQILGVWVAKTKRGFNKKQLSEIKKIREVRMPLKPQPKD